MIDLLPQPIQRQLGRQTVEVVHTLAPWRDMLGAGKTVVRALRLESQVWEVHWVKWRFWWQRQIRLPRVAKGTAWLDPLWRKYAYLRSTEIVADRLQVPRDGLGDDCRVIGFDLLDRLPSVSSDELGNVVRRVFYLSTQPGDGLTIDPDATCVSPLGGAIRLRSSERIAKHATDQLAKYLAELGAREKGLVRNVQQEWVTPAQLADEYKRLDAESAWRWNAHR